MLASVPRLSTTTALTLLFSAGLLSSAAVAQTTIVPPEDAIDLAPIVVTASGFEQTVTNAPASISVITSEELEKGSFTNLADALREVQGVAVTGVADEQDIYIRGLPGQYTLILVDGKRQNTRDSRTNGSSGYEQSFIPPVSAIDRIEVVRGPMSSLYGSDAMGGVINVITKPVADEWGGEVSIEGTLQGDEEFENSQQQSFYLSGPIVRDRLGLQFWGRKYDQDASSLEGGPSGSDDFDLTGRLAWMIDPNNDLLFEAGRTQITSEAFDSPDYREHDRDHWSLTHKGRYGLADTELSFSHERGERTNYSTDDNGVFGPSLRSPEVTNSVLDAKATTPLDFHGQHMLTFGGQYLKTEIEDQNPGAQADLEDSERFDETFSLYQWALFVEDEWQIRDDFALTLGVRYNEHEAYGSHITPRIYGVWNATDALTVKGGISTGFRAPDIRSIVPGYAYTTGGRGCDTRGTCAVILGNEDLEPEETTNIELGTLYDGGFFSLGATAFRTEFSNKLQQKRLLNADGTPVKWQDGPRYDGPGGPTYYDIIQNFNVDEAVIQGLELTGSWEITGTLSMRASYTYTDSEQQTGEFEGFPLARTPEDMASLRFDWETPVAGLESWLSANYHGSEIASGLRVGDEGSPVTINGVTGQKYSSYTTVDVGGSYEINENATVKAAVYNLFDEEITEAEFNTVQEGRRLWLGLTTTF